MNTHVHVSSHLCSPLTPSLHAHPIPPTPHSRTAQLRRSLLSSNSSPILSSPLYGKISSSSGSAATTSGSAHSSRSLIELLSTALGGSGSRTSSPAHLTPSSTYLTPGSTHPLPSSASYSHLSQSLPRLCSDNIGKMFSFKEGKRGFTSHFVLQK